MLFAFACGVVVVCVMVPCSLLLWFFLVLLCLSFLCDLAQAEFSLYVDLQVLWFCGVLFVICVVLIVVASLVRQDS